MAELVRVPSSLVRSRKSSETHCTLLGLSNTVTLEPGSLEYF